MIKENYSLRKHNTFGLDVRAKYFFEAQSVNDLMELIHEKLFMDKLFIVIGEGSNILFTKDYDGLVIHPCIKGFQIIGENTENIRIKVSAGENWDDFVKYTVENGWGGLENLSYIPGSVGASPVQNIGAYGTEVQTRIISIEGINILNKSPETLLNKDCRFSYRNSIFKQELKGIFIITSVTFELDKNPSLDLSYDLVKREFEKKEEKNLSSLRQTIIELRSRKLPDPKVIGNAGSFFKNPTISRSACNELKIKYPDLPSYPVNSDTVKISAAWLIEHAGFKGTKEGKTGNYLDQALVIVNYGGASGKEILKFSEKIREKVRSIFKIDLENEVNII